MSDPRPIGVFDSGVGGLSVLREIRRELPREDLLYVADSGGAPYGDLPEQQIENRAVALTEFLLSRNAKAVVVACNTVTGVALRVLRTTFEVPIVGMEPAVKPAAASTTSGVIGVMATTRTLTSDNFRRLQERFGAAVEIVVQPCPGLADRVETGNLDGIETRALVESYVRPLCERGADIIVLGCTHYPFLVKLIQDVAGSRVSIIEPAIAVAREIKRRLEERDLVSIRTAAGTVQFWSSADPERARDIVSRLWKAEVEVMALPGTL